jgi:hypothetical protein
MYYYVKIFTVDEDYQGVINVDLLSPSTKALLVDSIAEGFKKWGHTEEYGEIFDASDQLISELLEQNLNSPINFPHHIISTIEITSKHC